jgi:uncharacterized protein YcgL (UPF0745 family)
MNSLNGTKKEPIDMKKIVERLKKQGIHVQLCIRPTFIDISNKECIGNA